MSILAFSAIAIHAASTQNAAPAAASAPVFIAEIRGTIDPATASYLAASIRKAEAAGAGVLIVELDTPGGLVSSVKKMAQSIDESKVPVVVYVSPGGASATSAGALLALASHVAAMAPGTHIGAAHPVDSQGKDIEGAMKDKAVNDVAAFARGLAELRGRSRELAEKVVTKSKSVTASEAFEQKFVDIIASDRSQLLKALDGREIQMGKLGKRVLGTNGARIVTSSMTWGQQVLHVLANPNIATMLMAAGVLLLYVEITTAGVIIPGILGAIALLVAFIGLQMLPIRMGGMLLTVLGIGMLIAEAFVVSHGALAAGGTLSFVLGLLWVLDPAETDMRISTMVLVPTALALGGGTLVIAVAAARIRKLSLAARATMGGGGELGLAGYAGLVETVDAGGCTGKALIRGETWDFECGDALQNALKPGDVVEVVSTKGMKAVVKPRSQG